MSKIYVVTAGRDDEYHIVMATTDKEKAEYFWERLIHIDDDEEKISYENPQIHEYDDTNVVMLPLFSVDYDQDDDVFSVDELYDVTEETCEKLNYGKICEDVFGYEMPIQAENKLAAVKIFMEKLGEKNE